MHRGLRNDKRGSDVRDGSDHDLRHETHAANARSGEGALRRQYSDDQWHARHERGRATGRHIPRAHAVESMHDCDARQRVKAECDPYGC
ncbi:MAG: hypothetical protein ACREJ3_19685, partial [Polyangiaceae bacterium]